MSNNKRRHSQADEVLPESPYYLRSKRFKKSTCDADTSTTAIEQIGRVYLYSYRSRETFMNLPNELLRNIFKYIDFEALASVVRLVNKRCMQIVQNILNVSFMRLDAHFLAIKKMLNYSLKHAQEDLERKCMCKLLNVLELVQFHYLPEDVREICQQAKKFTLCFDRISELPLNKSVFISGAKVVDILDCASQAKREVLYRKQIGNTLFLKLKYYFSNSWFIALDIAEDKCKDWQEQMRLLYMRIRRIVVSHTEMNLEYAQMKRENDIYNNLAYRLRSPINSVYTGFGEVEDKFFFYGVMNRGAYLSKFQDFHRAPQRHFDDPEAADSDESLQSDDGQLGLTVTVTLRCPVLLAPALALDECCAQPMMGNELDDNMSTAKRLRGLFDMQIEFVCPAGERARLPTKYIGHVKGRR